MVLSRAGRMLGLEIPGSLSSADTGPGLPPVPGAIAAWDTRSKPWTAAQSDPLLDLMRNGHHCHNGSLRSAFIGDGALHLPARAGEYASAPGTVPSVLGDCEVEVGITPVSWAQGATEVYAMTREAAAGQREFLFGTDSSKRIVYYFSVDGTTRLGFVSTAAVPYSDGDYGAIRASRVISATETTVTFSALVNGVWTQIGAPVTNPNTSPSFDSTSEVAFGAYDLGVLAAYQGTVSYGLIRDTSSGQVVYAPNFTNQPDYAQQVYEAGGAIVTVNHDAVVDNNRTVWVPYRDDTSESSLWLDGTVGNNFQIPTLAVSTLYNYDITYYDGTTASGSGTTDASGVLTLGDADVNFANKSVARVVESGSGVFDVAFSDSSRYAEDDLSKILALTGQSVTINRTATGYKSVVAYDRGVHALATDDYLEADDHADLNFGAGEDFTLVGVYRSYAASAGDVVIGKGDDLNSAAGVGYQLVYNATLNFVSLQDGTRQNQPLVTQGPDGVERTVVGVRDTAGNVVTTTVEGSSPVSVLSTTLDITNVYGLRVGVTGLSTRFADMEFVGGALYRRALTDAEIELLVAHYTQHVPGPTSSGFDPGYDSGFGV